MGDSGSVARGPSELYVRLLKGEITSEEYMKRVGKDVARGRLSEDHPTKDGAQPARPKRR
jgi:hypothetical protein